MENDMWLVILMMDEKTNKMYCKDVFLHTKSTNKEVRRVLESNKVKKYKLLSWFITERQSLNSTKTEKDVFAAGNAIPEGNDPIRSEREKDE